MLGGHQRTREFGDAAGRGCRDRRVSRVSAVVWSCPAKPVVVIDLQPCAAWCACASTFRLIVAVDPARVAAGSPWYDFCFQDAVNTPTTCKKNWLPCNLVLHVLHSIGHVRRASSARSSSPVLAFLKFGAFEREDPKS
jgi:hypothetical protein